MTIREAQATQVLLSNANEFTMMFLTDEQRKAVIKLKAAVEKKKKRFPKYFKTL